MGLTMRERHAVVRELTTRYQKGTKKQRGRLLDEFVHLTGYSRCYAASVLRNCGKKQMRIVGGKRIVFVPGYARHVGARRQRQRHYGQPAFLDALKQLWSLSDGLCGKRLVAFIREVLPHLAHQGALKIVQEPVYNRLLRVSAATIDQLLAATKRQIQLKGRCTTHPATLLTYHIPVRTFADWNEQLAQEAKDALTRTSNSLNVLALKRELNRLQMLLFHSAIQAGPPPRPPSFYPPPEHPLRRRRYGRGDPPSDHQRSPSANPGRPEAAVDFHQNNHNTDNHLNENTTNHE
jgi:hypothetical protein